MKVSIYIDAYHTGHLRKGTGSYNIVLEFIASNGKPITREYFGGLKSTTKNRAAIYACITALQYLITSCDVVIVINSEHVVNAINSGNWISWLETGKNAKGQPAKNLDLWQQLYDITEKHNVTFTYAEKNPYTIYMTTMAKKIQIEYKEDTENV